MGCSCRRSSYVRLSGLPVLRIVHGAWLGWRRRAANAAAALFVDPQVASRGPCDRQRAPARTREVLTSHGRMLDPAPDHVRVHAVGSSALGSNRDCIHGRREVGGVPRSSELVTCRRRLIRRSTTSFVDRLPSIIAEGGLLCDAAIAERGPVGTTIGMTDIKQRRLSELRLNSHRELYVGACVPFYFCPRSVMLYVISQANLRQLSYRGGQDPIVHLEADLQATGCLGGRARSPLGLHALERRCPLLRGSI